jgi:hypothetical protein
MLSTAMALGVPPMPLWVGEVPLIGGVALLPLLPDPLPFPAKVLIAPGKKPEGES